VDIVVRSAIIFAIVFLVIRVIGRRELSRMEPFDLIILVVIGDIIQQGVNQSDLSVTGALISVATIALLTVAVSWIGFRFRAVRPLLESRPIVLVEDGRVIEGNLRRERLTVEEITSQARLQKIDSLARVRWAVLERSGDISFIEK
jgi:uncharacterized membrane protein YcaP (DUF421 family)